MEKPTESPVGPTRTEPDRAHEALRSIAEATGPATGEAFFRALVEGLVAALDVRHAFLALAEDPPSFTRARTLAAAWDGAIAPNFTYDLSGTPCERVLADGEAAFHNGGVAGRFPRDAALARRGIDAYLGVPVRGRDGTPLGLIVAMHGAPIDERLEPRAVVQIFAARVGAELERIRAEEALRAERDFTRAVLDTSVAAVLVVAADGRVVFASERAARILGIPAERLVSHPLDLSAWRAAGPDGRRLAPEEARARLLSGESFAGVTVSLEAGRGARRVLRVNGAPLGPGAGAGATMVLSVEDVTERRGLEEQLAHAQRLEGLGRLAGGVAHDFNNLLTVVLSNAQLAADELPLRSPLRDLVEPIREAAQRGTALTRQLLAFARKQAVSPAAVDLGGVVRGLGRLLQRLLGERVVLGVRLDPATWRVWMDPGQLEQVLVNLAVNARDAMPEGGRLTVTSRNETLPSTEAWSRGLAPGDYVHLAVTDTGSGMDESTRVRVFEPFFTTKGDRGTGLGLATCHGIVQQAGGAIWVESEPGRGASFHFLLPRHADAEEAAVPTATPSPRSLPATVLVVEDDDGVRRAAARSLRRAGYGVLAASSGPEALRLAAEHGGPIDLLLSDVGLPGMSGPELAGRLGAQRPGLRVAFVSGYSPDDREGALPGPGAAVLAKPYAAEELVAWVAGLVGGVPGAVTAPASSPAS
ncbi:MAG TPA: ATP-binding protein [Anaeromyxobacteraceae bacterium]|nr:ATP-binding protein [Anaeromyxobacteraceae bacterium]